jgi:hypothetical protein
VRFISGASVTRKTEVRKGMDELIYAAVFRGTLRTLNDGGYISGCSAIKSVFEYSKP